MVANLHLQTVGLFRSLESERMWKEYAGGGSEGVATKSTIGLLAQHVFCDARVTTIGRVQYVDLDTHVMSHYEANQAQERAFLKGETIQARTRSPNCNNEFQRADVCKSRRDSS
jgi:hypothetical protein